MKEIDYINSNKSNKNKIKDFFSFKKPLLKNFWFYFITIFSTIFLIFVNPILINESYKYNSGYITLWNAADVLSYYAVILTGVISVSILAITILVTKKQTDKQIKHQLSQSQFPFFQIDWIRTNNNSHFKKHQDQTWNRALYAVCLRNLCLLHGDLQSYFLRQRRSIPKAPREAFFQ